MPQPATAGEECDAAAGQNTLTQRRAEQIGCLARALLTRGHLALCAAAAHQSRRPAYELPDALLKAGAPLRLISCLERRAQVGDVPAQNARVTLATDDAQVGSVAPGPARMSQIVDLQPTQCIAGHLS